MENASKALIIAGAILLAIVIISLGLIVVNNTRNTVDTANLNEQEIQAFNAKFASYEGTNVSGARVNSLIQQVIATNQAIGEKGENYFVAIAFPTISGSTANPYVIVASQGGGVNISSYKNALPTSEDAIDTDTTTTKIVGVRNFIRSNGATGNAALSVNQKATYKVTLTYHNGMVAGIVVDKE